MVLIINHRHTLWDLFTVKVLPFWHFPIGPQPVQLGKLQKLDQYHTFPQFYIFHQELIAKILCWKFRNIKNIFACGILRVFLWGFSKKNLATSKEIEMLFIEWFCMFCPTSWNDFAEKWIKMSVFGRIPLFSATKISPPISECFLHICFLVPSHASSHVHCQSFDIRYSTSYYFKLAEFWSCKFNSI